MSPSAPGTPAQGSSLSGRTTGRPHSLALAHFCLHGSPHAHRESVLGVTPPPGSGLRGAAPGTGPGSARGPVPQSPPQSRALVTPHDAGGVLCTVSPRQHSPSAQGSAAVSGWAPSVPRTPPPKQDLVFIQKVEWVGVARAESPGSGATLLGLGVDKALSQPPRRSPDMSHPPLNPGAVVPSTGDSGCIRAAGGGRTPSCTTPRSGLEAPLAWDSLFPQTHTRLDKSLHVLPYSWPGGGWAPLPESPASPVSPGEEPVPYSVWGVAKHSSTPPRRVWFAAEGPGLLGVRGSEVASYHGHSLRRQHLLRGQCGEVGQVRQHVHQGDDGEGDDDGQGQVSGRRGRGTSSKGSRARGQTGWWGAGAPSDTQGPGRSLTARGRR